VEVLVGRVREAQQAHEEQEAVEEEPQEPQLEHHRVTTTTTMREMTMTIVMVVHPEVVPGDVLEELHAEEERLQVLAEEEEPPGQMFQPGRNASRMMVSSSFS
jgi:hypothetical protein